MTDTLDIQRKRLLFRSKHRGTKEADLLFGAFAERHLAEFDRDQLDAYEKLIAAEDPDLWDWVIALTPAPLEFDTPILKLLRNFRYTVPFS
jgi:antitoxin CptB